MLFFIAAVFEIGHLYQISMFLNDLKQQVFTICNLTIIMLEYQVDDDLCLMTFPLSEIH